MPRKAKVLIVDDNAANRALAEAALEDEDYRTIVASDGEEALRLLDEERPDCVLLDVRMPNMDGFEVCRRIRSRATGGDVPVIFLTAQRDVDTFDAARQAGGDDFLTKPLQPAELVLRIQSALELSRANMQLREQIEIIKRQRDDLMRLSLAKERLTAFLVHDLKNPVNSMDLRAQQALRDSELSERGRRALLHIRDETRTLLRLILNLLDISRSDEGSLPLRRSEVALEVLAASVVEELELRATMSNVKLEHSIEPSSVSGDPDILRRVVANLVDNAIRHAPEGSAVVIGARVANGHLTIEVIDRGPGIPPEQRQRIFDPFVQLEAGERVVTRLGRGLGLTFCRVAAEAHGGRIEVRDACPGAIFALMLPCTLMLPSTPQTV
jgi:signal transduction histidine kinase